jgi:hypothetical protein
VAADFGLNSPQARLVGKARDQGVEPALERLDVGVHEHGEVVLGELLEALLVAAGVAEVLGQSDHLNRRML